MTRKLENVMPVTLHSHRDIPWRL